MKTAVRDTKDIDKDLRALRSLTLDCLKDSEQWKVAWERIDELLEERGKLTLAEEKISEAS